MKLRIVAGLLLGAILLGGAVLGRALVEDASGGGWWHEGGEAWDAERTLLSRFETGRPNLVFLVEAEDGDIDSAASRIAGTAFAESLETSGMVTEIESYWGLGAPDWFRSADGSSALVMARIPGPTALWASRADALERLTRSADPAVTVAMGGEAVVARDVKDSLDASVPFLAVVALISLVAAGAFLRSWRGAALIGAAAALAVSLTLGGLYGVSTYREMPLLAVLLGTAVAWGLTTANGLLVTARFMDERRLGSNRRAAMLATIPTAGRTVALASAVVAVVGAALWFLPTALLRSTGYAFGIAGLAAGLASVVVLGFVLAVVGTGPLGSRSALSPTAKVDQVSAWSRRHVIAALVLAAAVVVPPLVAGVGVATQPSGPESLAAGAPARSTARAVAEGFASDDAGSPFVVARAVSDAAGTEALTRDYLKQLSTIPGVTRVDSAMGVFEGGRQVPSPRASTARHRGADEGMWFLVATETGAGSVPTEVAAADAPFRTQMGGLELRRQETASVVESRTLGALGLAAVGIMLLIAWIFRSGSLGSRLGIAAAAMTAGGYAVLELGIVRGGLGRLLGFAPTGWIGVSVPPLGLGLGLALAAALLVYGGGAAREEADVTRDGQDQGTRALASSLRVHSAMAFLLVLPLLPVALSSWSTAKGIGAAAIATAVAAATLGRFVVLPVLLSVAPQRLWTGEDEGDVRAVYPVTSVGHHLFVAGSLPEVAVPGAVGEPTVAPVAADPLPAEPAAAALVAVPPAPGVPIEPAVEGPIADVLPEPAAAVVAEPVVEVVSEPEVEVVAEPVAVVAEPAAAVVAEPVVEVVSEPVAEVVAEPVVEVVAEPAAEVVAEPVVEVVAEPAAEVVAEPVVEVVPEPVPEVVAEVVPEPVVEVVPEPVVVAVSSPEPVVEAPEPVVAEVETAPEPVTVEREAVVAATAVEAVPEPAAEAHPPVDEPAPAPAVSTPAAAAAPAADEPAPARRTRRRPAARPEPQAPAAVVEPDPAPVAPAAATPATPEPVVTPAARVETPVPASPPAAEPEPPVTAPAEPQRSLTVAPQPPPSATPRRARPVRASDPGILEPSVGTVDVIKLTESVIASLESDTDFTTEVGTGLVANPSNNLSRVMEAILRDASRRGGQEVLVYGQASQDRYRWMVVDTGPRADNDPDRARTLAEAQRFIRRVGGIVECRPEGDFTVFVVEIPMAS